MITQRNNTITQLLPLLLVIFLDTVGYFIVIPVIIHIFVHNQTHLLPASTTLAQRDLYFSVVLMLSPLAFIICSPILGHFSDRYGRKATLVGALIAACFGFILPIIGILKKLISLIFIGRFIAGLSSSSQPIAQAGITDFTTGKQRAFYLALIGAAMTLGMVIGPITSSLLSLENVTTPYWLAFILSLINLVLLIVLYKNPHDPNHPPASHQRFQLSYYLRLITHQRIWLLLLGFFFLECLWSQYYQALFLTLDQHFHYSVVKITVFTAYIGLWMTLGLTIIYKKLIAHYSIENILKASLVILLISIGLCNIQNTAVQWVMMIPVTICFGIAYPSILHITSHRTDSRNQGYILGSASTMLGLAWMITGLIAGPMVATWFALPTIISTACAFISLLLIVAWGKL